MRQLNHGWHPTRAQPDHLRDGSFVGTAVRIAAIADPAADLDLLPPW